MEIQLELIQEEKADSEMLLKKGLTRKTHVLELRRTEADLIGKEGQMTSRSPRRTRRSPRTSSRSSA